jgi:hypothetical protein
MRRGQRGGDFFEAGPLRSAAANSLFHLKKIAPPRVLHVLLRNLVIEYDVQCAEVSES